MSDLLKKESLALRRIYAKSRAGKHRAAKEEQFMRDTHANWADDFDAWNRTSKFSEANIGYGAWVDSINADYGKRTNPVARKVKNKSRASRALSAMARAVGKIF